MRQATAYGWNMQFISYGREVNCRYIWPEVNMQPRSDIEAIGRLTILYMLYRMVSAQQTNLFAWDGRILSKRRHFSFGGWHDITNLTAICNFLWLCNHHTIWRCNRLLIKGSSMTQACRTCVLCLQTCENVVLTHFLHYCSYAVTIYLLCACDLTAIMSHTVYKFYKGSKGICGQGSHWYQQRCHCT